MSKVKGPLGSLAARGSVGGVLTFSRRKTGQQVRFQRKQKDAQSPGQLAQRANYYEAVEGWNNLALEEQQAWGTLAVGKKMSGYNFYLKSYLLGEIIIPGYSIYGLRYLGDLYYGYEL